MNIHCSPHVINLIAFMSLLTAIVALSLFGDRTDLAIMTGLVGVLGTFRPWTANPAPAEGPSGTEGDPMHVAGAASGEKPVDTKSAKT